MGGKESEDLSGKQWGMLIAQIETDFLEVIKNLG